ncbi:putative mediator of RNA polymerase II transcription subunit 12 [Battus philenor]|uniref:putative mediator of RNA polymerase II transcription subunit 12 n=1 Tax=Battus philenor TaxID=42288 RepID=UPI0035D0452D
MDLPIPVSVSLQDEQEVGSVPTLHCGVSLEVHQAFPLNVSDPHSPSLERPAGFPSLLRVCLLVLAAVHAELHDRGRASEPEKRALAKESPSLNKRAPALSTVSSSLNAGVEYADTKQLPADKSPSQREYPTPNPQFAKFSDLLAGQAPSYQAAIASQLFAPISVYQPRTGTPTTYEVSAPVPSQLAYSEHYQQPNAVQYTPQVYTPQVSSQTGLQQQVFAAPQIYNQPQYQQIPQANYQQPTAYNQIPIQYSQQQFKQLDSQQALQSVQYQQTPKAYSDDQQNLVPLQYNLAPQTYYSEGQQLQQQAYVHNQQPQNFQYVQPGVTYSRQEEVQQNIYSQPELKSYVKPQPLPQNAPTQPQGPVSFASFSQNQAPQSIIHHPYHQSLQQVQQYSGQAAPVLPRVNAHERQLAYFRQGPQFQIVPQAQLAQQSQIYQQPQTYQQPQAYHQAQPQIQYSAQPNPGYQAQAAAPVFPAVQYFGKYAQSIFNKKQQ